jgi:hypothetical protein
MKKMNQLLLAPKAETAGNNGGQAATAPVGAPQVNAEDNKPIAATLSVEEQLKEVTAKLTQAQAQLAKAGVSTDMEPQVIARMRMGLSREDAIVCTRRHILSEQVVQRAAKEAKPIVVYQSDGKTVDERASKLATDGARNSFMQAALVEAGAAV